MGYTNSKLKFCTMKNVVEKSTQSVENCIYFNENSM